MTPVVAKEWFLSKTLVVNAISLVALAVVLVLQNAGALHLSPEVVIYGGIALTVVNAGLRLVTNTAIEGMPSASGAVPTAPTAAIPTAVDFARQIEQIKQQRDALTAMLSQVAAIASTPTPTGPTAPVTP